VDRINEMMDQLAELSDEQVVELQQSIVSEFETVEGAEPTQQSVDMMTSLADMLDSVRSEMRQREAVAAELSSKAEEAANRVYGEAAPSEEDGADSPESSEAMPEEEPMPETEAAMDKEDGMEKAPEAPMKETEEEAPEADAEAPEAPESDKDEDEDDEKMPASTASTETDEATELSTEPTTEIVADATSEASVDVEEAAEASTEETSETELSAQDITEAPVTAAANEENLNIEVPADRRPAARESNPAPVAITAGADIPGYTAGSPLEDMNAVAEAMAKRIHSLRRVNGGDGEQHIVASVTTEFPSERILSQDPEENYSKVQAVVGPEALVAAGGHQAPFEVRYDIFGFGTTARPVRDALPRFQADRGGVRYILPPVLSSYGDAVGVWTAANDAAESPDPATKTSLTVAAASETTVATDAVTLQMQFGNLATRAYPELISRHNELGLIQHAREAEQYLLSKIAAGSTAVTTTSLIGVARDFLVQLGRAATAYRSRHRLEADAPLRVILPTWLKDAMAADLTLSMPGDSTLNAYGEIDAFMAARGVVASYSLDQNVYGAQSVGTLNEFADSFVWYLFAEGTFLFLDGGTLDLGIIRDSSLVGTNDYKMFVETFEGVAKVGIESLVVTSTISVNGVAAALRDTTGGATAAAIEY
jgi:chemotaxis protein histidine kinase CheA